MLILILMLTEMLIPMPLCEQVLQIANAVSWQIWKSRVTTHECWVRGPPLKLILTLTLTLTRALTLTLILTLTITLIPESTMGTGSEACHSRFAAYEFRVRGPLHDVPGRNWNINTHTNSNTATTTNINTKWTQILMIGVALHGSSADTDTKILSTWYWY